MFNQNQSLNLSIIVFIIKLWTIRKSKQWNWHIFWWLPSIFKAQENNEACTDHIIGKCKNDTDLDSKTYRHSYNNAILDSNIITTISIITKHNIRNKKREQERVATQTKVVWSRWIDLNSPSDRESYPPLVYCMTPYNL